MSYRRWRAATLAAFMSAAPLAGSLADWRNETGTFRIGLVARADRGGAGVDYTPAAKAISEKIGMPVEILPMLDYPALIEAQMSSRIEYAVYSATAYGAANAMCECIVPLAAPVTADGAVGTVALAVSTDSDIAGLDDLPSAKLAWPKSDPAPQIVLREELLVEGKALTGDEKFLVSVASPEDAVTALRKKKADTLIGWAYAGNDGRARPGTGTLAALEAANIGYETIWTSTLLRFGPHAVRKDVPSDIRAALQDFLVNGIAAAPEVAELIDESFTGKFEAVTEADYAGAVERAQKLRTNGK
jgi:phosphonate transport system substrate-binding protein